MNMNTNGIINEILLRRARRALDEKPVPENLIERILHAASLAPSCFNNQPWRFVVVNEQQNLKALKEHLPGGNYWAKRSPCIVCAVTDTELDCRLSDRREYALFDTGLAVENLILQATKEGLIAHPIAGFKPLEIKKCLGIPDKYVLITLVVLGYPGDSSVLSEEHRAAESAEQERKRKEEIISFNGWKFSS